MSLSSIFITPALLVNMPIIGVYLVGFKSDWCPLGDLFCQEIRPSVEPQALIVGFRILRLCVTKPIAAYIGFRPIRIVVAAVRF